MGTRFKVGDPVNFKRDTELYGRVEKLYATGADVKVWNSITGGYDIHHVPIYKLAKDD
jgi:hypothetical protein